MILAYDTMDRGASSFSASRTRPQLRPVVSDGKGDEGSMLKSPVDTIATVSSTSSPLENGPRSHYQELRFLVTGSKSCGKTTFIQKALDMKKPMASPNQAKKMSLDGQIFMINLTEVPIEEITLVKGSIRWPSKVGNIDITTVDGVLALYDITKKESLTRILALLSKLSQPSHGMKRLVKLGSMLTADQNLARLQGRLVFSYRANVISLQNNEHSILTRSGKSVWKKPQ